METKLSIDPTPIHGIIDNHPDQLQHVSACGSPPSEHTLLDPSVAAGGGPSPLKGQVRHAPAAEAPPMMPDPIMAAGGRTTLPLERLIFGVIGAMIMMAGYGLIHKDTNTLEPTLPRKNPRTYFAMKRAADMGVPLSMLKPIVRHSSPEAHVRLMEYAVEWTKQNSINQVSRLCRRLI